eukprot:1687027-Amphidinium_carterae.2
MAQADHQLAKISTLQYKSKPFKCLDQHRRRPKSTKLSKEKCIGVSRLAKIELDGHVPKMDHKSSAATSRHPSFPKKVPMTGARKPHGIQGLSELSLRPLHLITGTTFGGKFLDIRLLETRV